MNKFEQWWVYSEAKCIANLARYRQQAIDFPDVIWFDLAVLESARLQACKENIKRLRETANENVYIIDGNRREDDSV